MEIKIEQVDSLFSITIDGTVIPNVSDYKIISSAHDGTELDLKIVTKDSIKGFVLSTKTTQPPQ